MAQPPQVQPSPLEGIINTHTDQTQPEPVTDETRRGYYELADRMSFAENELAIFRNFKTLNILSLLILQAEIHLLEDDLEGIRIEDDNSDGLCHIHLADPETGRPISMTGSPYKRKTFSSSVTAMQAVWKNRESDSEQYAKLLDIREKLREYKKTKHMGLDDLLVQFGNVCKLDSPDDAELRSFNYWTSTRFVDKSREVPLITPPLESTVMFPLSPEEYVLLQKPNPEKNIFSPKVLSFVEWMYKLRYGEEKFDVTEKTRGLFFRRVRTEKASKSDDQSGTMSDRSEDETQEVKDVEEGKVHFRKSRLIIIADWLAPILAAVLLISTSLILYSVQGGTRQRLFIMMPLTVIFSLVIKFFTSATRLETFTIIAAFVGVELVFLGNVH